MKRIIDIAMVLFAALIMMGCSEQDHAQDTIEDFLNVNLLSQSVNIVYMTPLDSTRHLTDSVIGVLQEKAEKHPLFNKNINFAKRSVHDRLLLLTRVSYLPADAKEQTKESVLTFYLTPDLKSVVAFKDN
ncbi:MAG: hypothetical protein SO013_06675 [Prevotella sp.]|nr:hypothetical protein [Prevotella sp.]